MDKRLLILNTVGLLLLVALILFAGLTKQDIAKENTSDDTNSQSFIEDLGNQGVTVTIGGTKVQAARELLADKFHKRPEEIQIEVTNSDEHYFRGHTIFGNGGLGNRGVVFTSNINGEWELVWDSEGNIPCAPLEKYEFPENMIWDCVK